jgi:hypothetical protein
VTRMCGGGCARCGRRAEVRGPRFAGCGQRFAGCGQRFAGKGSRAEVRGLRANLGDVVEISFTGMLAAKAVRAQRPKLVRKHALVQQPIARCLTGYFCSVCRPDYSMALAMGLHPRLGEESPVAVLTEDVLRTIIEMTRPKRQLPLWMSCDWHGRMQQRRRARAVLDSSRTTQRKRLSTPARASNTNPETATACTATAHPSQTA